MYLHSSECLFSRRELTPQHSDFCSVSAAQGLMPLGCGSTVSLVELTTYWSSFVSLAREFLPRGAFQYKQHFITKSPYGSSVQVLRQLPPYRDWSILAMNWLTSLEILFLQLQSKGPLKDVSCGECPQYSAALTQWAFRAIVELWQGGQPPLCVLSFQFQPSFL